jgi:hypothetical protein
MKARAPRDDTWRHIYNNVTFMRNQDLEDWTFGVLSMVHFGKRVVQVTFRSSFTVDTNTVMESNSSQ